MELSQSPSGVEVSLSDLKTWKQFYPNTEMIVTKRKGRVIFPHLNYNIKGLNRTAHYEIYIHLERADKIKYKFDHGHWQEVGKGDAMLPVQYKQHPEGARPGDYWMKEPVSFSHLKITNDPENTDDRLILVQSMHKFRPVITIKRTGDFRGEEFRLSITEFYVVTAYQNTTIIDLKVANNKFASGFRSNKKRKNSVESDETSPNYKRRSTSSDSSTSSPLGFNSPPSPWDTPLNALGPLNPVDPVLFNQHPSIQNPHMPMQNQFLDFQSAPWNQYHPGHAWYWGQMGLNMAQWNNGNQTENTAPNGFSGM